MIINDNELIAEEGKILTNGEIYAHQVILGIYDSIENWHEILEEEQPIEDEIEELPIDDTEEYAEAGKILLGITN